MNRTIAAILVAVVAAAALAGCRTPLQRETPPGHACYRQFSYDRHPRYYACLFELSAPSAFYSDKEVDRIIDRFMAAEGGECTRGPERDVADIATQNIDHALRYRLFNIVCK